MHASIREAVIASVRRRASQGDCPTEPAHSIETLENTILDLAAGPLRMDAQKEVAVNCFGIPDSYNGCAIHQGPDDLFYASLSAPSWDDLKETLDHLSTIPATGHAATEGAGA